MEGVKVSDVESIEAAGLDREVIARNALRALIKQLPVDGFFHADPHPGNLLVNLDTGVLTFIDLGMMGELDVQKRLRLAQLMVVAQQGSAEGMASALRGMSVPIAGEVDERVPAGLRAPDGPLHGPGSPTCVRADRRRGLRGARACTVCGSTRTSRSRSRPWCRPRASAAPSPPAAASSPRACRCSATWSSRASPGEDPGHRDQAGHGVGRRGHRAPADPGRRDQQWLDQYQRAVRGHP